MQRKRLSIKANLFFNSFGSLFYLACQWLITVLVVRLGSFEAGGLLTNCISITNVLFTISTFGIRTYQVSDIGEKYTSTHYVTTRLITGLFAMVITLAFVLTMGSASIEQKVCVVLYMLFRLTEALSDVLQGVVQKADRMDYIGKGMVMRGVMTLGFFVLVMVTVKSLPLAILAMALGAYIVIFFYEWRKAESEAPFIVRPDFLKTYALLKTCWPLMLTSFFANAIVSIPRYLLGEMLGEKMLGFYGAIAIPTVIVQTGSLLIFAPMVTAFSRAYINREGALYRKYFIRTFGSLCALVVLMIALAVPFGAPVLQLLFTEAILPYASLLTPVLLVAALIAINLFLTEMLTISRRLKLIMFSNLLSAMLSFVLSRFLIAADGMNGVNITLYISLGAGIAVKAISLAWDAVGHFKREAAYD